MAETRGDPVVRSIIEDDELVPAEGSGSQEKPPIVTVLPSGNDDELVPAEDPNDKLTPAEDPNDELIPVEIPGGDKPIVPGNNDGKEKKETTMLMVTGLDQTTQIWG